MTDMLTADFRMTRLHLPRGVQSGPQQARPQQARPQQARPQQARPQQARPQQARPQQARPQQARCLVAVAASLWMVAWAQIPAEATPIPTVVFGNLGSTGAGSLDNQSVTTGSGVNLRVAQGFVTGSNPLTSAILTVSLGIAAPTGEDGLRAVQIWSDSGSNLPSAPLFTSNSTFVSSLQTYSFSFPLPWLQLDANTKYWIVPTNPVIWYGSAGDPAEPAALNGSDWTYAGTARQNELGNGWTSRSQLSASSISVIAVPEPDAVPVAGIGLLGAGWAVRRVTRRGTPSARA